jgi:hypothetical protein
VASKLGFLFSGPLPATPMHKNNTYIMNVITAPPPICDLEEVLCVNRSLNRPDVTRDIQTDMCNIRKQPACSEFTLEI